MTEEEKIRAAFRSKKNLGRKRKKKIKEKISENIPLNEIERFYYEKMIAGREENHE